ncbi:amidohydrolase family protein [Acidianus sulfidivorans JP7]|uniref:Amidohydrolase n=1 Tax=Acidianus sulfidivorans JP7 TaxID=619593 RepID=A0A2U9ILU0_9CREN|nr:amidohydrolase family protein [Acidianus sulfidivorans]AWR96986.1 amidohydrolase family protein [Acidianus sulfidivorans JP7]
MIDSHAHWFSARIMSEKEFMMATAESWKSDEMSNIEEMNYFRPFYFLLRNELKKLLGENFIDERNKRIKDDSVEYVKFLLKDAGVEKIVIDEGFGKKSEIPIPYALLFRIESIINENLFSMNFDKAVEFFEETLRSKIKNEKYAGFKSIIAYRTGLKIYCDEEKARRDFFSNESDWYGRKSKGFRDYLFCKTMEIAKDLKVPFQVHTGAGDRDIKFELSKPSYLTDLVRKYEGKIVFVHAGFPWHRETAWMSYLFPSVYLDVSQVFPFATTAGYDVLREVMQVAPFNKIMYGSDAFEVPEIAWISARMFRKALDKTLEEMLEWNIINDKETYEVKRMICYKNAEKLYFPS